jgi:hypothetical protein
MQSQAELPSNRRAFLRSGIIFTGAVFASCAPLGGAEEEKKDEGKETEVGPPEDLMREHGVLKRVLLIYGEALRRLNAKQDFPPDALADAARIIRSSLRIITRNSRKIFSSRVSEKPICLSIS